MCVCVCECVCVCMYMYARVYIQDLYTYTYVQGSLWRAGFRILGNWFYRLLRAGHRRPWCECNKDRKKIRKKEWYFFIFSRLHVLQSSRRARTTCNKNKKESPSLALKAYIYASISKRVTRASPII